jgi:hypothetical protein
MIQPKFNYRSIITFLLGLTISYFLFIPGIKFTKIKWLAIESINGILNQKLDHFFADTYLYLHTADQQSRQILVGPYQLKLSPIQLDSKYDTQLNLLNEKKYFVAIQSIRRKVTGSKPENSIEYLGSLVVAIYSCFLFKHCTAHIIYKKDFTFSFFFTLFADNKFTPISNHPHYTN